MLECFYVGLGGALGSIARYGLNQLAEKRLGLEPYLGTFSANLIGCFLIGVAWYLMDAGKFGSPRLRLLIITGFLGGLTTFSTFSHQSLLLHQQKGITGLLFNVGLNVILGLLAVAVGFTLTNYLSPTKYKPTSTSTSTSTHTNPTNTSITNTKNSNTSPH